MGMRSGRDGEREGWMDGGSRVAGAAMLGVDGELLVIAVGVAGKRAPFSPPEDVWEV